MEPAERSVVVSLDHERYKKLIVEVADPQATLHDVIHRHLDLRADVDVNDRGIVRDVDTAADLRSPEA